MDAVKIVGFQSTTKMASRSRLISFDKDLSKTISLYKGYIGNNLFHILRPICKAFEWSGHGVIWLVYIGFMILTEKNISSNFFYKTVFIGLLLDLIVIAILKLAFKRQRPFYNEGDLPLSASKIDGFSFPSGHATRAFMLYVLYLNDFGGFDSLADIVLLWAVMLGYSRVALGRHYISDVVVGTLVGLGEGYLSIAIHKAF